MPQTCARPATRNSRPGSDDFSRAAETSSRLLPENQILKQEADRRLRRQRQVERLHRLGARAVFELVDEIARHHPDIADDLDARLARFARLDPAVLAAVGADRLPGPPMRAIGGGR